MIKPAWITRRWFVQMTGMTALGAWAKRSPATVSPTDPTNSKRSRFAFVGAMGNSPAIHVYAIDGEHWQHQQIVASEAPASLALHPSGEALYVLNEVSEYRHLPSGMVTAYRLDPKTGQLALLGLQSLSLSATMPRHIAVAPDGKNLVVAVHGGGAYNLLPILPDGQVGEVCGILKETGCGPVAEHQETAHPQAVLFDTTGSRVIAADLGNDRVSVLSLEDTLRIQERHPLPAGSGPRHLALHPSGHLLYVAHALDGSISGFAYDPHIGKIGEQLAQIRGGFGGPLAIHPTGNFLYAANRDEVTTWRIDNFTGALRPLQSRNIGNRIEINDVHGMIIVANGSELTALIPDGVMRIKVNPVSGRLDCPSRLAFVPDARCITVL
jgi:6-phosphogluconolactonase